jgi:hypothetical protein
VLGGEDFGRDYFEFTRFAHTMIVEGIFFTDFDSHGVSGISLPSYGIRTKRRGFGGKFYRVGGVL